MHEGLSKYVSLSLSTLAQREFLAQVINEHQVDILGQSESAFGFGFMDIRLSQQAFELFNETVQTELGFQLEDKTLEYENLAKRRMLSQDFVCQDSEIEQCGNMNSSSFHATYQSAKAINRKFNNLANNNPDIARLETLGWTFEGREQQVLFIGDDDDDRDESKPLVFYFCAMHAREWITPMYCTHLAESLLDSDSTKSQQLLKFFSFAIVPIVNVDGYVYSHEVDHLWRKTRVPNENSDCIGTDPNRNFGFEWGGIGASSNPCSSLYSGSSSFDQPCVRNLKSFTEKHANRLIHVVDVHAFGHHYLMPQAFTESLPLQSDFDKMQSTGRAAHDAIFESSGLNFSAGPAALEIYPASGSSIDYFYNVHGIVYSGSFEARSGGFTGLNGFQPPVENIKMSNAELFEGSFAMLKEIVKIEFCEDRNASFSFSNSGEAMYCQDLTEHCDSLALVRENCALTCDACLEFGEVSKFFDQKDDSSVFRSYGKSLKPSGSVLMFLAFALIATFGLILATFRLKKAIQKSESFEIPFISRSMRS